MIQSVKDGMELAGKGINNFLTDKEKLRNTAFTVSALAVGIYTAKVGTGVLGRFIEANLGKPSLVRDTSRITVSQFLSEPIKSGRQILGFNDAKKALEGIVLEKNLSTQVRNCEERSDDLTTHHYSF